MAAGGRGRRRAAWGKRRGGLGRGVRGQWRVASGPYRHFGWRLAWARVGLYEAWTARRDGGRTGRGGAHMPWWYAGSCGGGGLGLRPTGQVTHRYPGVGAGAGAGLGHGWARDEWKH